MFICDGLQHGRIYAEEKRTEKNLIVRSGISEAETTVLIIKDCARGFALKLYRHEASRGLFATAELLDIPNVSTRKCLLVCQIFTS